MTTCYEKCLQMDSLRSSHPIEVEIHRAHDVEQVNMWELFESIDILDLRYSMLYLTIKARRSSECFMLSWALIRSVRAVSCTLRSTNMAVRLLLNFGRRSKRYGIMS